MPINMNQDKKEYKAPPWENDEVYFGRVVQVIDLGLQDGGEYQGEKKRDSEQVLLTFEFNEVRNEDDKPCWLSVFLSLPERWENGNFKGMHVKSNIYKYLNMLVPEELYTGGNNTSYVNFGYNFSWDKLLNKPLQLKVKVNDEGRARIVDATKVGKKFLDQVAELENTPVVIDMESVMLDQWKEIYPWVRKLIGNSLDESVANKAKELDASVREVPEQKPKAVPKKKSQKEYKEELDEVPFDDELPF